MILFDLRCAKEHVFEAWFPDSRSYEDQVNEGKVACPRCGSTEVEKAPMAPHVARALARDAPRAEQAGGEQGQEAASEATPEPGSKAERRALRALRAVIERNFDYVGGHFPEEARRIHYGESEARNIYGEASSEEAKSLLEEGVSVGVVPWLPREN